MNQREANKRPDTVRVLNGLKGFQRDTVEYAFERLYLASDSTRRFLVADEVGLGKTLVARGVIAKGSGSSLGRTPQSRADRHRLHMLKCTDRPTKCSPAPDRDQQVCPGRPVDAAAARDSRSAGKQGELPRANAWDLFRFEKQHGTPGRTSPPISSLAARVARSTDRSYESVTGVG